MRTELLTEFVGARQRAWHRRHVLRRPPPWTDDPVLQKYRFTNLQRELDRGTRYLADMLASHAKESLETRVTNALVYRWLNNWQTWDDLVGWFSDRAEFVAAFDRVAKAKRSGRKVFTSAWTVDAGGAEAKGKDTVLWFRDCAQGWDNKAATEAKTVEDIYRVVTGFPRVGQMVGWQQTLDLIYLRPDLDDDTWLPPLYDATKTGKHNPGGSANGAMLVNPGVDPRATVLELRRTRGSWLPSDWSEIAWSGKPDLSLADIEHTLCEFDKWIRARDGKSLKRLYRGVEFPEIVWDQALTVSSSPAPVIFGRKPTALGVHIFAGGFTIGVEKHFDVVGHLERGMLGVKSFRRFRPTTPVHVDKKAEWKDAIASVGKVDVVYGNPPCASWSTASIATGRRGDTLSGDWAVDVLRVADAVEAKVVLIESVRGAHGQGAATYRALAAKHGMTLSWVFVNAVDHGLAQNRARVFLVFGRNGEIFEPAFSAPPRRSALQVIEGAPADVPTDPAYMRGSQKDGMTWRDVALCIPGIPAGKELRNLDPEDVRKYSPVVARYLETCAWPFGVQTPVRCYVDDRPTSVVFGNAAKFIHPIEDRLLTFRELMRMQGYPDDYEMLEGGFKTNHQVLGKTVCPPVGAWIAREAAAYLHGARDVTFRQEAEFACCSDRVKSLGKRTIPGPQNGPQEVDMPAEAVVAATPTPKVAYEAVLEAPRARKGAVPGSQAPGRPQATPEWPGMDVKDFWEFVYERQAVWSRRVDDRPRPWTDDLVMRERFFTNVFRELDPGTLVSMDIMGRADRPGWERLWNLVLYRYFNREDSWREVIGYIETADALDVDGGLAILEQRIRERREAGNAIFTNAHQVNSLVKVEGNDLLRRIFSCMRVAYDKFPDLAARLQGCTDIASAFHVMRDQSGVGIGSFLGWQLTLDATLGPDPVVVAPVNWAPVTTGAKVGLVLHMNWPRYGMVGTGNSGGNRRAIRKEMVTSGEWPALDPVPSAKLEATLLEMVEKQDQEFARRGLNFRAVAAAGYERLNPAAVEHALCEWQKYLSIAVGGPASLRVFDKTTYAIPDRPAVKAAEEVPAAAAPEPTGGDQNPQSAPGRRTRPLIQSGDGATQAATHFFFRERFVDHPSDRPSPCSCWVVGKPPHMIGGSGVMVKLIRDTGGPYCAWDPECVEELTAEEFIAAYPKFAPKEKPPRAAKASQKVRRPASVTVEMRPEWLEIASPTELARQLIAEGKADDFILAAVKPIPKMFTRSDLGRLRARLERKA